MVPNAAHTHNKKGTLFLSNSIYRFQMKNLQKMRYLVSFCWQKSAKCKHSPLFHTIAELNIGQNRKDLTQNPPLPVKGDFDLIMTAQIEEIKDIVHQPTGLISGIILH